MKTFLALIFSQPWLVCLIFVLIATFGFEALAAEIEVEAGKCHFDDSHGAFKENNHKLRDYIAPPCGLLSYSDKFRNSQWGYSIGLFASRMTTSNGNRAVDDSQVGTYLDIPSNEGVMNAWSSLWGILPRLTYEKSWGRWSLKGEAGVLFQDTHVRAEGQSNTNNHFVPDYNARCHIESPTHIPAPEIGLVGGYQISDKWKLTASVRQFGWMNRGCALTNYDHSMFMVGAGVSYQF